MNYNRPRLTALCKVFEEVLKFRKEVKAILEIENAGTPERQWAEEMGGDGIDFAGLRGLLQM